MQSRSLLLSLLSWTALSLALASPIRAETIDELIATAEAAERDFDYDRGVDIWVSVIARDDASAEQRLLANLRAGHLSRALDRDMEARMHYLYVLRQQPDFKLPADTSPKLRNFFELVRQEVRSDPSRAAPVPATTAAPDPEPKPSPVTGQPEPPAAKAPEPAPAESPAKPAEAPGGGWGALQIGATAATAAGLLAIGAGGITGWMSLDADLKAEEEPEQIAANRLYDDRNNYALAANISYGAAALMLVTGGTLATLAMLDGGE